VRHTAILYYVDDMTQEEIAEHLDCSRKVVRKRLAVFNEVARNHLKSRTNHDGEP
jgi:RNA polymerase sigma-70 factor (ECF subfamily)